MSRPKWTVHDDVWEQNAEGERVHSKGEPQEVEMPDSDYRLYRATGWIAAIAVTFMILLVIIAVLA